MSDKQDQPEEKMADLRSAIENLATFAEENARSETPNFQNLSLHKGQIVTGANRSLSGTVELARRFVTALLSNEVRKQYSQHQTALQMEIIKAVELVRANYLVLDQLKEGNLAERRLAEAAIATVERFNQVVAHMEKPPETLGGRLTRFLFRKAGLSADLDFALHTIDLPLSTYLRKTAVRSQAVDRTAHSYQSHPDSLASSQKRVSTLASPLVPGFQPTLREGDAFRLKALSLLRQHSPASDLSWEDALQAVRQTAIQSSSDTPPGDNSAAYLGVVTFKQTLQPFPGELIVLEGSFQRDAQSPVASVPIPSSFRLSANSAQTGFPHPSQYNGWALGEQLIPRQIEHFRGIPQFEHLFKRKRKLAEALSPQGRLNRRAKEYLRPKKQAFERDLERFLALHRQLAQAILVAAHRPPADRRLNDFFHFISQQADPYQLLSLTYQAMGENFIAAPYEKVRERSSAEISAPFYKEVRRMRRQIARPRQPAALPSYALRYLELLGPLLGEVAAGLCQQQLSKAARPLTDLEKRFQAALYRQQIAFLEELEFEGLPDHRALLESSLLTDIALFEDQAVAPHAIVEELEGYFTAKT